MGIYREVGRLGLTIHYLLIEMKQFITQVKLFVVLVTLISPAILVAQSLGGQYTIGTSGSANYVTLAAAIEDINSNGLSADVTFTLEVGTYNETMDLSNLNNGDYAVSFLGTDKATTIIHPMDSIVADSSGISLVSAKNITLKNMTLEMDDISSVQKTYVSNQTRGINIVDAQNITLREMIIRTSQDVNGTVFNVDIASSAAIDHSENILIDEVNFSNAGTHVFARNFQNLSISNCSFAGFHNGIRVRQNLEESYQVNGLVIDNNSFSGDFRYVPINITGDPTSFPNTTTYLTGLEIRNNQINADESHDGGQKGMYVEYTKDAILHNNVITGAYYGIWSSTSPGIVLTSNYSSSPEYRALLLGYADDAVIANNIFVSSINIPTIISSISNLQFVHNTSYSYDGIASAHFYDLSGNASILNNIFAGNVTAGFSTSNWTVSSLSLDHNLYPAEVPAVSLDGSLGYSSGDYSLLEWQALQSSYDVNSQSLTPVFTEDFRIGNATDFRFGQYIESIKTDIDGDTRLESGVDVGADQYCGLTSASVKVDGNILSVTEIAGATYQWYNCDTEELIAGEINYQLSASEAGNYYVQIDNGVCSVISECAAVSDPLSVNAEISLVVFPNPTSGFVRVVGVENQAYQLVNMAGQVVQEGKMMVDTIELNVPKGIYLLRVGTGDARLSVRILRK